VCWRVTGLGAISLMLSGVGVSLRTKVNIAFQCAYHVVWCARYRRGVVGGGMEEGLTEIIAEVIAERGHG
jgi:putative transposase